MWLTLSFQAPVPLLQARVSVPRQTVEWDYGVLDLDEAHCVGGYQRAEETKKRDKQNVTSAVTN